MTPELQIAAQVAQLGIGTLMAFGILGVVWYLLKCTIPGLTDRHAAAIEEVNKQHLKILDLVVAESKRSNEAICSHLEKLEERINGVAHDLASMRVCGEK